MYVLLNNQEMFPLAKRKVLSAFWFREDIKYLFIALDQKKKKSKRKRKNPFRLFYVACYIA